MIVLFFVILIIRISKNQDSLPDFDQLQIEENIRYKYFDNDHCAGKPILTNLMDDDECHGVHLVFSVKADCWWDGTIISHHCTDMLCERECVKHKFRENTCIKSRFGGSELFYGCKMNWMALCISLSATWIICCCFFCICCMCLCSLFWGKRYSEGLNLFRYIDPMVLTEEQKIAFDYLDNEEIELGREEEKIDKLYRNKFGSDYSDGDDEEESEESQTTQEDDSDSDSD